MLGDLLTVEDAIPSSGNPLNSIPPAKAEQGTTSVKSCVADVEMRPLNPHVGTVVTSPDAPALVNDSSPLEDFSDNSVTPGKNFKNLKRIDECAQQAGTEPEFQLSRAQRKRLRKSQGKSPSPTLKH
ncbi:hypothetical protein ACET3Z_031566 [Daucus carota]